MSSFHNFQLDSFEGVRSFFREYLFAKCWEQGLHTRYGELFLSDGWAALNERLEAEFGSVVPA